jgi:hypothetical protein
MANGIELGTARTAACPSSRAGLRLSDLDNPAPHRMWAQASVASYRCLVTA